LRLCPIEQLQAISVEAFCRLNDPHRASPLVRCGVRRWTGTKRFPLSLRGIGPDRVEDVRRPTAKKRASRDTDCTGRMIQAAYGYRRLYGSTAGCTCH
jgi:hypothetical protein